LPSSAATYAEIAERRQMLFVGGELALHVRLCSFRTLSGSIPSAEMGSAHRSSDQLLNLTPAQLCGHMGAL
jgi:hypothetical protein